MKAARASLIAVLLSAACAQVQAVPIVFEFTGVVTSRYTQVVGGPSVIDDSLNGVAYTASLTIDSDLLLAKPASNDYGDQWVKEFADSEFGAPGVTGSLMIGGEAIDLRPYSRNLGNVAFNDTIDIINQNFDGQIDSLAINANSRAPEPTFPAQPGVMGSGRNLSLIAYELWSPEGTSGMGSFENLSLDDLLTMPLPNATLRLWDAYWTCETTYCIQLPVTSTSFSIDTLTRRVASVPEPATWSLLALGLIGAAGVRRRQSRA